MAQSCPAKLCITGRGTHEAVRTHLHGKHDGKVPRREQHTLEQNLPSESGLTVSASQKVSVGAALI
jgi:hypothetical protein